MKMMNKKALLVVFCVLLPILIVLFSYEMVFAFSSYDAEQQGVLDAMKEFKPCCEEGVSIEGMTLEEESHLGDVRRVMVAIDFVFLVLLFVCAVMVSLYYKKRKELGKLFYWGGIVSGLVVIVVGLLGVISFNWLFTIFHEIFFPQGNWQFAVDSMLIQTFPLQFFIWMLVKIVLLSLVLASFFILGSIYLKKK